MLRHLPKFHYSGLSIILANQSRFDDKELLSGNGGYYLKSECLQPEINIWQCDVRLIDDPSPLLPNTKVILLLGEKAHHKFTGLKTSLDENRGSPVIVNSIPCISSFTPQDAVDPRNHEARMNEHYEDVSEYASEEIAAGEVFESKGRGKTKRNNYRFWLKQDTKKAIRILNNNGILPSPYYPAPNYHIYPNSSEVINLLTSHKNDTLYIDIETDFITLDIRCIAFAFERNPLDIYVVPILTAPNYEWAYNNVHQILRGFSVAFRDNITCAHNGQLFDFLVFAWKYRLCINKAIDTMLQQQRIYPDVEKSLGHCVSLWTYEPYHKNEGVHSYMSKAQAESLYLYCGKDVYTMMLVNKAQREFAKNDFGLLDSIERGNRAIKPYLTTTFLGMHYNEELRQKKIKENDRLMMQYLRIIKLLTGDDIEPLISNKKCVEYFHNRLNYKVVGRTETGAPSLKEEDLLKLKIKYPENIVIDFLIKYRGVQKETGVLNFKSWIN
jgi:hypothetical protein